MKRRQFITRTAVTGAAAAAAATVSAPAISQGRKELKMVTSFPKNFPGLGTSANRVAARLIDVDQAKLVPFLTQLIRRPGDGRMLQR